VNARFTRTTRRIAPPPPDRNPPPPTALDAWRKDPIAWIETFLINPETDQPFELLPCAEKLQPCRRAQWHSQAACR
jgi:hypothetical protein